MWNFRVSGSTEKITIDDWMPSKLDEHVKLRLHYAVSTGFLLKDWPSTGRTDWPYQGPPVQIGVQKGLMMTSDEEQIGFVFFLGGPTST